MKPIYQHEDRECQTVQERLPVYVENALSARETWDVEKHLASCTACAEQSRQFQAVVSLLRAAEQRDTSDDFMARLHARLDTLEPEAARAPSLFERLREGMSAFTGTLRGYRAPAFGVSLAALVLVTVFLSRRPDVPSTPSNTAPAVTEVAEKQVPTETLRQNVAIAASNPFEDPVAATLDAQAASSEDKSPAQPGVPSS